MSVTSDDLMSGMCGLRTALVGKNVAIVQGTELFMWSDKINLLSAPTGVGTLNVGGALSSGWTADSETFWTPAGSTTGYNGSLTIDTSKVFMPAPADIYKSWRYTSTNMTFTGSGNLANTTYRLRLHFCDLNGTAAGRVFDILVNGVVVFHDIDVWATVGAFTAMILETNVTTDASGTYTVTFSVISGGSLAFLNGLETWTTPILPTPPTGTSGEQLMANMCAIRTSMRTQGWNVLDGMDLADWPIAINNPGLLDFWLMNEGSGVTLANKVNPTNTLAATNITWATTPNFVNAPSPQFNGVNSILLSALNNTINGPFSVCFAVYFNVAPTVAVPQVFIRSLSTAASATGWQIYAPNNFQVYLINDTSLNNYINTSTSVAWAINTPWYLCFTYDGSSKAAGVLTYVNGAVVAPTPIKDTLSGSFASGVPIRFGIDDSGGNNLNGTIANVRIYNRVLTATEISDLYKTMGA